MNAHLEPFHDENKPLCLNAIASNETIECSHSVSEKLSVQFGLPITSKDPQAWSTTEKVSDDTMKKSSLDTIECFSDVVYITCTREGSPQLCRSVRCRSSFCYKFYFFVSN